MSGPLPAPERVLPTLNADGTRRLIHPKLQPGRYWRARLLTGWGLIALFVALPFVNMNGKPVMLLDVPARQFHLFGSTFLATDGVLLMLLLLSIFVLIIWLTALLGRGWCGWACPQTVYMEFLFRPIERLFEGDRAKQIALDKQKGASLRRIAKNLVFALLSVLVANVFLAYFVGVERLSRWVTQSPLEHPTGFLVMAVTAGLVMLDFAWFREQMCTVACPYARLQSVLLDERSLVVAYDGARGEPRSKGKPKPGSGDCIDCNACVVTCPTGIDIREGLQLECIACTQCMDACDSIMDRIGKPRGLIRYSSQEAMETRKRPRYLRPRVLIYPVVLAGFVTALLVVASRIGGADVTILRGIGAPFVEQPDGIQNQIRVKIENRTSDKQRYQILILDAPDAKLIAPENPLPVRAGSHESTSVFVIAPRESFHDGQRPVRFQITDESGFQKEVSYKLLGPRDPSAGGGS
ncbi:MAG: cytochrome c oxidase accessory protein CcoG [Myxococcales bacterium]|nr:cytochrome c oxidase accessory protein CcoG [Myxococcales bacterium]